MEKIGQGKEEEEKRGKVQRPGLDWWTSATYMGMQEKRMMREGAIVMMMRVETVSMHFAMQDGRGFPNFS